MRSLDADRVHTIRTVPKPDGYYARLWRMTTGSIHHARTGRTWADHPTPPDTKARDPGRPGRSFKRPATDIDAALSAWRSPDNGRGD